MSTYYSRKNGVTNKISGLGSYTEGDGIDISGNEIKVDTVFNEAVTRTNIASGDSLSTIFGKIKKWFTDIPNIFRNLTNPIELTSSDDLDDIKTVGNYFYVGTSNNYPINAPNGFTIGTFTLTVETVANDSPATIYQTITETEYGDSVRRHYSSSTNTWSTWRNNKTHGSIAFDSGGATPLWWSEGEGETVWVSVPSMSSIFNAIYPVGSIYMSTVNTNPGTLFGGTWVAWGSGKVPVGVNTSDTDFNTVEKTGGVKSVTLTGAQSGVPKHRHTIAHGHGFTQPTITVNYHQGSSGYKSLTTDSGGAHKHNLHYYNYAVSGGGGANGLGYNITNTSFVGNDSAAFYGDEGGHTHTIGQHSHTISHGHTASASGGAVTDASSSTYSGYQSATSASEAHTNLQPYITCYMWKRTA